MTHTENSINQTDNWQHLHGLDEASSLHELDEWNEALYNGCNDGYYIGIMSGTSLDAMDLAVVEFAQAEKESLDNPNNSSNPHNLNNSNNSNNVKLIATLSLEFPKDLHEVLSALCQPHAVDKLKDSSLQAQNFSKQQLAQMSELDWFGWASRVYAEFTSDAVLALLKQAQLSADNIIAIGCHGQTVRHRPQHGFTLQLVDANIIAERTAISVVTDFRRRDMAVGGQGAPLVPAFHHALFASQQTRVLLNLGGIANITVLPADKDSKGNSVVGYDTGPANLLLDAWISQHTEHSYDESGTFARSGQLVSELLTQLLTHPYFVLAAPKSTGREDFHMSWLTEQLAEFKQQHPDVGYSVADIQATLTELTAVTASQEIIKFATTNSNKPELYVCGGGAYNDYLLERLAHHLPEWSVATTNIIGLEPTWVEATAFAWLAKQTIMGQTANLPAVTGANKEVVLGQVCFAWDKC